MKRALLLTALGLVGAPLTLVPAVASADCPLLGGFAFTYPSAETAEVPLNAVFWAVPRDGFGGITFRVDGDELRPVGDSNEERFQFAPSELSPGEHDVEIAIEGTPVGGYQYLEGETLRLRVQAVEQAAVEAEGTIDAVTYFPLSTDGLATFPDVSVTGEGCEPIASLTGSCHDIIPLSLVRLDLSTSGNPLGFLVEDAIVPASCSAYFPHEYDAGGYAPYEIRAVLPTGLAAPRAFQGEGVGLPTPAPAADDSPPLAPSSASPMSGNRPSMAASGSCALRATGAAASSAQLIVLAAVGVLVSRRSRR